MGSHRINPNWVKIHWNYTAHELASRLGIHKNTVRHWQRGGLTPIDDQRPQLFRGSTVRAFLIERNRLRKRPCDPGMIYCFGCREPRKPVSTAVEYVRTTELAGNLRAPCCDCGTIMHRRVRQEMIHSVLPGLLVQITEVPPRLNGSSSPSPNCDFERQATE